MKIAVYAGSFDPVTNGHVDIALRALKIFDKVIVAVLRNSSKTPVFTIDERVAMLKKTFESEPCIEVDSFDGLLSDYVKKTGAAAVIRGIRSSTDFEQEMKMDMANKKLNNEFETVLLTSRAEHVYLSSGLVKEIAAYGGDISEMLPKQIIEHVLEKFGRNK